ncbi:hypothetical protein Psfp_04225 [Pelotomaculum sp. FP]|uniref:hypothetical protein n=1 Tax=Pelotomaculum sp. FP TaxID=261474 RepID=UPI0011049A2D|nr:hypothetical protein [Pelotomaculum sp. FP]TEB09976.1 hypothetical protein Psfp_04225 [Pelotomaculum sp. FP]
MLINRSLNTYKKITEKEQFLINSTKLTRWQQMECLIYARAILEKLNILWKDAKIS